MSLVEDQMRATNDAAKESNLLADAEHLLERARQSLTEASYYDPRVVGFKERRRAQAMQERWWKPSIVQVPPKKRVAFTKTS